MAPEEILELDCAVLFPQCTLSFFFFCMSSKLGILILSCF